MIPPPPRCHQQMTIPHTASCHRHIFFFILLSSLLKQPPPYKGNQQRWVSPTRLCCLTLLPTHRLCCCFSSLGTTSKSSEVSWCQIPACPPTPASRHFGRTEFSRYITRTYVWTCKFGSERNFTRNLNTHFRCKRWTQFCPRSGPIRRYIDFYI